MLKLLESVLRTSVFSPRSLPPLRSVRPSLLDLRFTGDPQVVDHRDGSASVQLDNYTLAQIDIVSFDAPSLNRLLLQLRQWQMRRRLLQPCRNRLR
jgi:hypothetical protein